MMLLIALFFIFVAVWLYGFMAGAQWFFEVFGYGEAIIYMLVYMFLSYYILAKLIS